MDIGIVGAGGAGLVAAWLLGDAHRVTLYERDDSAGRATRDTVRTDIDGERIALDSGVDFFWPADVAHLLASARDAQGPYPPISR